MLITLYHVNGGRCATQVSDSLECTPQRPSDTQLIVVSKL